MVVPLSLALMGLGGCNPYDRWTGDEFNAGPVDPINFPPEYLGAGGNRQLAGSGSFTAAPALVDGAEVGYFIFSFSAAQLAAKDPLAVNASSRPNAYVFQDGCKAPEGYSFDPVRDDVDYSQQGVIFSRLPSATYAVGTAPTWTYVPIVAHVPVKPNGVTCQTIKSETVLTKRKDVSLELTPPAPVTGKQVGIPDGTYYAYAIIEPGAAVYGLGDDPDTSTGVGRQKWGWYNQYLLAYLDGGQIPTEGGRLVTQKLYHPRSPVIVNAKNQEVSVGEGYDVLTARRGQAGYSPVCQVFTYDAGGPLTEAQLPKSAAEVETLYGATLEAPLLVIPTSIACNSNSASPEDKRT
ncbi:hypothetical protein ACN28S_18595 [Cystobacter fuscus]